MNKFLTNNTIFSLLLAIITALILYRITPPHVSHVIKLTIAKNRTSITSIYQGRNIEATREVWVDRLDLRVKDRFRHPKLGNIVGYDNDYFVDIDRDFEVLQAGRYQFLVGSDDGFSLTIDGRKICEHLGDRPFAIQTCILRLQPGIHRFHLAYFQGFGNSGLSVEYEREQSKRHWFGDSSGDLHF